MFQPPLAMNAPVACDMPGHGRREAVARLVPLAIIAGRPIRFVCAEDAAQFPNREALR